MSEPQTALKTRAIAISTNVSALVGDTCATILLSQLIYWSRRGVDVEDREGWIFKTARDWEVETGLSRKMQRRARGILVHGGWIEERLQSMPARLEFRLRLDTLLPSLARRSDVALPARSWSWAWVCDLDDHGFQRVLGRSFQFYAAFAAHMPIAAAMLASRLLSASGSVRQEDVSRRAPRFVQLHRNGWRLETGLTRDQWQSARKVLRGLGMLAERRRNFPRRIDLAIDAQAAMSMLNGKPPVEAYGWKRAKHEGGFGLGQNPPTVGPDSTYTVSPNQPLCGAQTRPYFSFQGVLPQQPQAQTAWAASTWSIRYTPAGWDQGGPRANTGTSHIPAASQRSSDLVWPRLLADKCDRAACEVHLAGLSPDVQQAVLDELDFIHAAKAVARPVGLVRTLCQKARAGRFVAEGAHHIAGGRRLRAQAQARLDMAKQGAHASAPAAPSATVDVAVEVDRLRQVGMSIRSRGTR